MKTRSLIAAVFSLFASMISAENHANGWGYFWLSAMCFIISGVTFVLVDE